MPAVGPMWIASQQKSRMLRRRTLLAIALVPPVLTTCSSPSEVQSVAPPTDVPITSLAINAPSVTEVGEHTLLSVTAYTGSGSFPLNSPDVTWSSDDGAIANVAY